MKVVVTHEAVRRGFSYALGKAAGQKPTGSGDPANEFSITTVANKTNGVFDGTYTVELPDGHISQVQLEAVVNDPNPEQAPLSYTGLRRSEYPSIADQMDMIYWDLKNGTATFTDAIDVVKAAYPKM